MLSTSNYVRSVGRLTLLSGLLAFACNILLALAVKFNFDTFAQPALIFGDMNAAQVAFFRWGMITDLWGYYLLFVPLVFFLFEKMESPWRNIFAASGIAYAVMGAIGAAILTATGTHFLREYLQADAAQQPAIKESFLFVYHIVNNGIWNLLEMCLIGIFMFGAAPVLQKFNKSLYFLTILLGVSGIIDTLGHTVELPILSEIGLNFYLLFEPIWAISLGIVWMRSRA